MWALVASHKRAAVRTIAWRMAGTLLAADAPERPLGRCRPEVPDNDAFD